MDEIYFLIGDQSNVQRGRVIKIITVHITHD
jgi:hypothetical protein